MEDTENTPSLMNKKADELTVADNFKLVAIMVGAFVAIPVVIGGASAAVQTFAELRRQRKAEKKVEAIETTAEEAEVD